MKKLLITFLLFTSGFSVHALDSDPDFDTTTNTVTFPRITVNKGERVIFTDVKLLLNPDGQWSILQATPTIIDGDLFLADNAKKEGVITTASGLQYKVLTQGKGASPAATDEVTVHYRGTKLDGTEFDSSFSRNAPSTFALNRVIDGWTEGVQLMNVGASYRFFIPSNLAYGERGRSPTIAPNEVLIFEVELIAF